MKIVLVSNKGNKESSIIIICAYISELIIGGHLCKTLVPLPFIAPQTVTLKLTNNLLLEYCSTLHSSDKIILLQELIPQALYALHQTNRLRLFAMLSNGFLAATCANRLFLLK